MPNMNAYPIMWKEYGITDEDTKGEVHYFGWLNIKGGWYIREFNPATGAHRYKFGYGDYPQVWKARAFHSYKYVTEVHQG